MGAPFDFSSLFRDPSAQGYLSGIDALYRQPERDYFDQEDPNYQKYVDLAKQAPPSEGLLSSFMKRLPQREDYQPGTGKKIGGFLLGTLAGMRDPNQAYRATREFSERPYTEALADWNQEGKFVDDQARLADAARTREMGSLKFGLEQGARSRRYQGLDEQKAKALATTQSGKATDIEQKNVARDDKVDQNAVMNSMRELGLKLQEQGLKLREQGLNQAETDREWHRTHATPPKTVDPLEQETKNIEHENSIRADIQSKMIQDPKFSKFIDPKTGGIRPEVDPKTKQALKDYLEGEFQKRMIVIRGGR